MSLDENHPEATPDRDELKRALKAFRKRLKLTRLDAESNISGGPLSGGKKSTTIGITPPDTFRQEVWDELVKQGKLKYVGHGIYEVVEES